MRWGIQDAGWLRDQNLIPTLRALTISETAAFTLLGEGYTFYGSIM